MKSRIIALLSCVTLLLATATVSADTFKPKIYQVYVDDNGVMTILGTGFPEGGYVQTLKVGGIPATNIVYDGVADSVQAQVPAQLGPGDYRLLVNFKLNNNAKNVIWDLSIGPQGPQGEQGEQGKLGEVGAQGEQGKLGPPGGDGAQGIQGKIGPQGEQGKMGPPGDSIQGPQGKEGPQGEQGKIGPAGQDGTSCSLGECSDAGEATLSCGSTETVIPCVPPVSCPCSAGFAQTEQLFIDFFGSPPEYFTGGPTIPADGSQIAAISKAPGAASTAPNILTLRSDPESTFEGLPRKCQGFLAPPSGPGVVQAVSPITMEQKAACDLEVISYLE